MLYCVLVCVYPSLTLKRFCVFLRDKKFSVMNVVGSATTRRFLLQLRGRIGRVSNHGYIGARPTLNQIDIPPSQTWLSNRQGRTPHRHLATTSTTRHASPLSDAYLDLRFTADTTTMASLTPPQSPPSWQHTVEDVDRLTTEALAKNKQVSDEIVQLPEDKLDFDNVRALLPHFRFAR